MNGDTKVRHVLGISGGKDSAALAIFMRDKVPEMEYFFCDTEKELPETYEYLAKLEVFLGKPIARLNSTRGFDHWLQVYGGYLPSSRMRWCTRQLKLKPLEDWIGDDPTISYVAIRADENRDGHMTAKPNLKPVYPFKEAGIVKDDVFRILEQSGIGVPTYYEWRTRSGCYFCFFQRKSEWLGLKERHPDLFEKAKLYEKIGEDGASNFTWSQTGPLTDLENPIRAAEIRRKQLEDIEREQARRKNRSLIDVLETVNDAEDDDEACLVCTL